MFDKNNLFLLVAFITINLAQSESPETIRAGISFINKATSPDSISSRFLDLGGVIRQLFSGFNQGTPRGGTGLNSPPNSQFYPGVRAQSFNFQPQAPPENKWSNLNQGIIQGGIRSQQQNQPYPSSLNLNSQTLSNQGQLSKQPQDLAQILNIKNNNGLQPNLFSGEQEENTRFQRSDFIFPQSSEEFGSKGNQNENLGMNEGTLDDFFTTTEKTVTANNNENDIIWGLGVKIPSTTVSNDRIVFEDDSETPYQKQCVQNCPTTSEYDPVCGTDSVTYFNPGRLVCARNCGINVRQRRRGSCNSKSGR